MHITAGKIVRSNSSLTVAVEVHIGNRVFSGQTISLPLQASHRPGKKLSHAPPLSPTGIAMRITVNLVSLARNVALNTSDVSMVLYNTNKGKVCENPC